MPSQRPMGYSQEFGLGSTRTDLGCEPGMGQMSVRDGTGSDKELGPAQDPVHRRGCGLRTELKGTQPGLRMPGG